MLFFSGRLNRFLMKRTSSTTLVSETLIVEPPGYSEPTQAIPSQWRVSVLAMGVVIVSSIGGFIFGYESGQISGFLVMSDFAKRFGENGSFPIRQGAIVSFFAVGTLFGCLCSAPMADIFGRRRTISGSSLFYIIGVIIEITSTYSWVQFAIGRIVAGLGVGALSTVGPMYQSESVPKKIRAAAAGSFQLMIMLGIWTAYIVSYGTEMKYTNSAQWRIPNGLAGLWAVILGCAMLLLPESPRYVYRKGNIEKARRDIARLNRAGVLDDHITKEISEIQEKLDAELRDGKRPWHDFITGPRMLHRTLLGMVLQAGQQLTGANYFFYYGTTIFEATGLKNSYLTSVILGSVCVLATVAGFCFIERVSRRKAMMIGAIWMACCLFVFSFVGHFGLDRIDPQQTPQAGNVMIVFTCLFIAAFTTTWGPLVWTIVGELYPARHRATCMALATSSNWLFNFLISFFSTMITERIDYLYGLVFGCALFILCFVVYVFLIETKGRSFEEIDTIYVLRVKPTMSERWNITLTSDGRSADEEVLYSSYDATIANTGDQSSSARPSETSKRADS